MKKMMIFLLVALALLSFGGFVGAQPDPPSMPDYLLEDLPAAPPAATTPPAATATATREYKNPCPKKPGTRWCDPLKKCVKRADFKKECKKEGEEGEDGGKPDCDYGFQVVIEDGAQRCETIDEAWERKNREAKEQGPKDSNGNCIFGPFPDKDDEADESGDSKCWTYEEAREKHDYNAWFGFFIFLCLVLGVVNICYTYRLKEDVAVVKKIGEKLNAFLKQQNQAPPPPKT